ncbi:MAG: hypothetical protein L3J57_14235 [Desulfuromusa sp.]|nr:hypothetical protein [Desulfuromusa sp.]
MSNRRSITKGMAAAALGIATKPFVAQNLALEGEDTCLPIALLQDIASEDASVFSAVIRVLKTHVREVEGRTDIIVECFGLDTFSDGLKVVLYFAYEGHNSQEANKRALELCEGYICKASGCFCLEHGFLYFFFPVITPYHGDIEVARDKFDEYFKWIGGSQGFPEHPMRLLRMKLWEG